MGITQHEPLDLMQQPPPDPASAKRFFDRHAAQLPRGMALPRTMEDRHAADDHAPVIDRREVHGAHLGISFEDRLVAGETGAQHAVTEIYDHVRIDDAQLEFLAHEGASVVQNRIVVTRKERESGPIETERPVSMNYEAERAIVTSAASRILRCRMRCIAARKSAR